MPTGFCLFRVHMKFMKMIANVYEFENIPNKLAGFGFLWQRIDSFTVCNHHFNMHWSYTNGNRSKCNVVAPCHFYLFNHCTCIRVCVCGATKAAAIQNGSMQNNKQNIQVNAKKRAACAQWNQCRKKVFSFVSGKFNCLFIVNKWKGTLIPNDNKHALQWAHPKKRQC